jgi:hypothetical protein
VRGHPFAFRKVLTPPDHSHRRAMGRIMEL